jgi:hypothetical protein
MALGVALRAHQTGFDHKAVAVLHQVITQGLNW